MFSINLPGQLTQVIGFLNRDPCILYKGNNNAQKSQKNATFDGVGTANEGDEGSCDPVKCPTHLLPNPVMDVTVF